MVISYNWLQSYFKEKLPSPQDLAELLTFHIWEVEEVRQVTLSDGTTDTILDIKVLPDRSCYGLSHGGIAYEVSALIEKEVSQHSDLIKDDVAIPEHDPKIEVSVHTDMCTHYSTRLIEGVVVAATPDHIKKRLEAIGQRSVNTIVDLMNYVMFDLGQPLHAFDADLISGALTVRMVRGDESMTSLDGKEVSLSSDMMVIADDRGPLALAGIKGGNRAAVTEKTKRIIIESATFDPATVRRTATKVGIRTDASKRFENGISAETTLIALDAVTQCIVAENPAAKIGPITDIYKKPESQNVLTIDPSNISSILGLSISAEEMEGILHRLTIQTENKKDHLVLIIPFFRKDLKSEIDIAEEVGRLYGYDKLKADSLPPRATKEEIVPAYFYEQKIRGILSHLGFSEVYTPTIVKDGDVIIANPLASDKRALRSSLFEGLKRSIELNTYNAPLLGLSAIKIFEIGTVFPREDEITVLGIAVHDIASKGKKNIALLDEIIFQLEKELGVTFSTYLEKEQGMYQINLSEVITQLPAPETYGIPASDSLGHFTPFSPYPFIVRDIAVFVPETVDQADLEALIVQKAGQLLVRNNLFDVFKKTIDGEVKVSYAFRLVFQSIERTLTDTEVNVIMNEITETLVKKEWQVR